MTSACVMSMRTACIYYLHKSYNPESARPPIHPSIHPSILSPNTPTPPPKHKPQEGHEEGILDRDPAELVPEEPDSLKAGSKPAAPAPAAGAAAGGGAGAAGGMVKRKEHPKYSKYFKMLKIGQPVEVVRWFVRVCKDVPSSWFVCARPLLTAITQLNPLHHHLNTHAHANR